MEKYDYVQVIDYDETVGLNLDEFIGAEGMIINIDNRGDFPIEVCFFNKELQDKVLYHGCIHWKENELEVI